MSRYVVFDVETPNTRNDRMSSIGITIIDNDRIVDDFCSLVNPETYFNAFNVRLTGINEYITASAPTFPELWREIQPIMSDGLLVAHNARFDLGALDKCLTDGQTTAA